MFLCVQIQGSDSGVRGSLQRQGQSRSISFDTVEKLFPNSPRREILGQSSPFPVLQWRDVPGDVGVAVTRGCGDRSHKLLQSIASTAT